MATPNWNSGHDYDGIFQKFRLGLLSWSRTGKTPQAGNQDIKYFLQLQDQRLKAHNLDLELEIQPEEEIMSIHKISSLVPILGEESSRFDKSLYAQYVTRTENYVRNGKSLLRQKKYLTMYQTILDPATGNTNLHRSDYVCPNCGAISRVEVLQNTGCPYCGTRYLMKDLYPKVVNYYFLDSATIGDREWKTTKKWLFISAGAMSLLQVLYTVLTDPEFPMIAFVPAVALGMALYGFLIYLLYSMGKAVWLLIQAGKSVPLLCASAGSKKKITARLQVYDPAFDYSYFEGKALSLARILMLSDNPEECVQYQGPKLKDHFSDVVDVQYRGGIGLHSIRRNADRIEVELDLFVTNTLDKGNRLVQKNQTVRLQMYHNTAFPVDEVFSIVKVQCNGCGGSFDAGRLKRCPFCGQKYDSGIRDWAVTGIRRR